MPVARVVRTARSVTDGPTVFSNPTDVSKPKYHTTLETDFKVAVQI